MGNKVEDWTLELRTKRRMKSLRGGTTTAEGSWLLLLCIRERLAGVFGGEGRR